MLNFFNYAIQFLLFVTIINNLCTIFSIELAPHPSYRESSSKQTEVRPKPSLVPPSTASSHSHEDQGELPFFSPGDEVAFGDSSLLGLKGSQTKDLFPSQEQIERAKKLHYVLCTKSEEAEASSLNNTLKTQFGGRTAFQSPLRGGDSFFLSMGRNLPQCININNNKVEADLRKALSTFIYDNKTYCEVRINLTEFGR